MKLSVLMPVYNEKATIREIVKRVLETPWEKELLIVDDGSTDGTRDILETEISKLDGVKLMLHDRNRGKGAAVRTALAEVTGDIVLIQDADLEYHPKDYGGLIAPILDDQADVVYGSRFLGSHRVFLFWHKLGNWLLTQISNLLYNTILTDMETCYKAFRADLLRQIPLRENGFSIEPELTAKIFKRGARVFEVPITYAGRGYKEGKKITWRQGFPALWALIKYRFVD